MVPRARREVEHEVALLAGQLFQRHATAVEPAGAEHRVRPDILADGDADALSVVVNDGRRGGGLEIAVLVKDVVGRQQAFARHGGDAAAVAEGGGVVKRATLAAGVELDGADERGDLAHGGGDLGERFGDIGDEAPLEQQVARRIAADSQLGEDHELGTLRHEDGVGVEDATAVAGKVADDRVELGKAEAHGGRGARNVDAFSGADNSQGWACARGGREALFRPSMSFPDRLILASASPRRR